MKPRSPQDRAVIAAFAERLQELRLAHPDPRRLARTAGTDGPALGVATDMAYMPRSVAADRAGLDGSYWGRLEQGRCDPTLTSLLRIQRAFGFDSIETLLGPTASAALSRSLDEPATPGEPG